MPEPKYGLKNSSAITRSLPSQNGWDPTSDREPGLPTSPAYRLNFLLNWYPRFAKIATWSVAFTVHSVML